MGAPLGPPWGPPGASLGPFLVAFFALVLAPPCALLPAPLWHSLAQICPPILHPNFGPHSLFMVCFWPPILAPNFDSQFWPPDLPTIRLGDVFLCGQYLTPKQIFFVC